MSQYRVRGSGLYNKHNHKIATTRGVSIFDAENRKVGGVRDNELFDCNNNLMMQVRGRDIFDAKETKVATLADAEASIEGAEDENVLAALWYCFVR